MRKDEQNEFDAVTKLMGGNFANMALAIGLALGCGALARLLGFDSGSTIFMGLMLGIMFGDLWDTMRGNRSWTRFGFYFAAGFAMALFIDLAIPETPTEGVEEEQVKDPLNMLWIMIPMFLIIPIVFLLPTLEKALNLENKEEVEAPTAEDIKISLTFPIYMCLSMVIYLAVPGALYLLDASMPVAFVVYVLGICLVVLDVASSPDEARERDRSDTWGPQAESSGEAWSNLGKGLSQCFASGLFLGATIYIAMSLSSFGMGATLDDAPIQFLTSLIWDIVLIAGASMILFVLGTILVACFAYAVGQVLYKDPLSVLDLAECSGRRLLMGGISWVQPHLTDQD